MRVVAFPLVFPVPELLLRQLRYRLLVAVSAPVARCFVAFGDLVARYVVAVIPLGLQLSLLHLSIKLQLDSGNNKSSTPMLCLIYCLFL